MFNQDALFKGYKKRLEKLPKAKPGSEATRMASGFCVFVIAMRLRAAGPSGGADADAAVSSLGGTVPHRLPSWGMAMVCAGRERRG